MKLRSHEITAEDNVKYVEQTKFIASLIYPLFCLNDE